MDEWKHRCVCVCSLTCHVLQQQIHVLCEVTLTIADCRCKQLHGILPDWLPTYWLKVISQPWEGDVTMVLPSAYCRSQGHNKSVQRGLV